MSILVVQDDNFNSNGVVALNTVSVSATYALNTTAGNLLICAVASLDGDTSRPVPVPTIHTPVTAGLTWLFGGFLNSDEDFDGVDFLGGCVAIYYVLNAPSISSATTTTAQVTTPIAPNDFLSIEISLYEFSGLVDTPLDVVVSAKGYGDSPSAGPITTTQVNDLIFVATQHQNDAFVLIAGVGFTLTTATANLDIVDSATEYKLNVGPGVYTAAFQAGTTPVNQQWSAIAIAFSSTPITPPPPPPPVGGIQQPIVWISS